MEANQPMDLGTVRVVAFQDGDLWVAQCVEYDIAAFAKHLLKLPAALDRAILSNVCVNADAGHKGLEGIPRAPKIFEQLFKAAEAAKFEPPVIKEPRPRYRSSIKVVNYKIAA